MAFNLTTTQEALLYQCRVTNVYPSTMSVDVYVPESNNEYKGVRLLSGYIMTSYGSVCMPEVGSIGIVALYHKSKSPVLLGFIPPYGFNQGNEKFEYHNIGDFQNASIGGGFVKGDFVGNASVGNNYVARTIYKNDGDVSDFYRIKKEFSNFHRKDLRIEDKNDIMNISDEFTLYKQFKSNVKSQYDVYDGRAFNSSVLDEIITEADTAINEIYSALSAVSDTFSDAENKVLTEIDIADLETLTENLKLSVSGLNVKCEMFKDGGGIKISLCNDDTEIAGIEIDENGGKMTGKWS